MKQGEGLSGRSGCGLCLGPRIVMDIEEIASKMITQEEERREFLKGL